MVSARPIRIRVDTGTYNLTTNLIVSPDDSGVKIEGYHDAARPERQAIINRGSTNTGSYVVEIAGADDVTLDHLSLTGGQYGVVLADGVDSDRVNITNCEIFANGNYGISIGQKNEQATIVGNRIHDNVGGIFIQYSGGATISDNVVYGNNYGGGSGIVVLIPARPERPPSGITTCSATMTALPPAATCFCW